MVTFFFGLWGFCDFWCRLLFVMIGNGEVVLDGLFERVLELSKEFLASSISELISQGSLSQAQL